MAEVYGPISPPPPGARPAAWLLMFLLRSVGLPFVLVATTGPLLQRWFSSSRHPGADDPYHLYGASNLGSIIALLSYPFVIEPYCGLSRQLGGWSLGYRLFILLIWL